RVEFVGPQVGKELYENGALALLLVSLGIVGYLALRFEWRFAVAAIIANLHDVIIILGFFAFFQWEFSLPVLAAVLAVLGYSVNESVVIADRIRENFRKMRKATVMHVIDSAITSTMSRTIITHGCTLLMVMSIFLFGGWIAARTRVLPSITGYIAIGFILGPGVLGLLNEEALRDTRIFADISLGLVVFELGRRLDLQWARHDRWLLPSGLAESLLSFCAMFALLRYFDIAPLEAAVAATVGVATAPAVVLLVAAELKAEGPVTRRALWHVALNNIIAMLGVTLLLPFIEVGDAGSAWSPT